MAIADADAGASERGGAAIEHRHLRSALEFAVMIAADAQKRKPALPYPKELKQYFGRTRLPAGSLGRIRRAIEGDALFRSRIAAGALPELVDEIGRLWLTRPDGWEAAARQLAAELDEEAAADDLRQQLKQAERRRIAAEQATTRTRAELLRLTEIIEVQQRELHEARAEVEKSQEATREMRTELVDARVELRHARDREAAAAARAERAAKELDDARAGGSGIDPTHRDEDVTDVGPGPDPSAIALAADAARALSAQLDALVTDSGAASVDGTDAPDTGRRRRVRRRPLPLPGGVISTSRQAAEFLARSDAAVLVDGYNVAKLHWPQRPLEDQRRNLLDAVENLAGRHGSDITVVFDGASLVGAHADRRRRTRVVYSPDGVTADDVIRDEVRRLPASRHVVVVTNDAEIVADVRRHGANVVPSNAFTALF